MKLKYLYPLLFLLSCSGSEIILPDSTGSFDEIIVVVNDAEWDETFIEIAKYYFESELIGVGNSEKDFKILQINKSEFSSLLKTHRHIFLISKKPFASFRNKWANNQLVVNFNNTDSLTFSNSSSKAKKIISRFNKKNYKKKIRKSLNIEAINLLNNKFDINASISSDYTISLDSTNVFWLSYNPSKKEQIKQLIFLSVDSLDLISPHVIINRTLFKYLKGAPENSYVKLEDNYPLTFDDDFYRGLWKLHNGFMGGPIMIKFIKNKNSFYLMIAVIFAPNSAKRTYIKEIEAIL